ncbi:MAG: dipeptide epimerase [Candidatus Omnitrophota bacterium]|nr:dipeptide epimerase [Candidatus Omnitrophota bacterium]MDZ4243188.1 dipeptide epimerase [Candidatus Omnitrophota bacterium]
MPPTIIKSCRTSLLTAPLIQPFRTALGEHKNLENLLFTVELTDGTKGYGEAAVATHITGETVAATRKNLQDAGRRLEGKEASNYLLHSLALHRRLPNNKAAVAAAETALLDVLTRQRRIPLWKIFGKVPHRLQTDITIVIADLAETEESVRRFYKQGFRAFKVKIGRNEELDLERVRAVKRLAPGCPIYLDANQGYSADQTLRFVRKLKRAGIRPALLEQPVPKADYEGLKRVTRLAGVPVCADESASSLPDAARIIRDKAAHVINIKLMKTGLLHSCEIAFRARVSGIKLMIGGMMETSLAMTAAAHLAAGLGGVEFVDLDTPFFLKGREKNPCLNSRGVYDVRKIKSGIGIIPG